jgi:hypothetical protein
VPLQRQEGRHHGHIACNSPPQAAATTDATTTTPPSPDPATEDDLTDALDAIIKGEADRQTAEGAAFVAMNNPSAAQVAVVRTAFAAGNPPPPNP